MKLFRRHFGGSRLLVNPAQIRKVGATTLKSYAKEIAAVMAWWWEEGELDLDDVDQLDESLATYHHSRRLQKHARWPC